MQFLPLIRLVSKRATNWVAGLFLITLSAKATSCPRRGKRPSNPRNPSKAGSAGSIKFKLWEGEISDPVTDNRFIGMFEIKGSDFDDGVIAAGAELICDYEILDSGNIKMEVSVPSIGGLFHSGRNFYSRPRRPNRLHQSLKAR